MNVRARLAALVAVLAVTTGAASPQQGSEILWDRYGVPHIFAADRESMFYAHGWAQAEAQADLLLRLYGESRGRGAEYWGAGSLELDRWLHLNGMPERAAEWYEAQDRTFRSYMDAFARGINDYAAAHPDAIAPDVRAVLPVSGVDVVGHPLRVVHYGYMGSRERMLGEVNAAIAAARGSTARRMAPADEELAAGSNTWAIGPSRSASGHAMLLINPHLRWGDTFYRYMEVHQVGPDYDLHGAPQVGFPVAVVGFNRQAGWSRTVNTIDTVDFYRLTVEGDRYRYDGALLPFERGASTIKVKQDDGTMREEVVEIRRSVHGPVVYDQDGFTVAMRVAGLDRPRMLEQWFRMGEARTLAAFTDALRLASIPMWNANYADDQGRLMLVFNGLAPRRSAGDYTYWNRIVPGDSSATLWTDYVPFDELPKSIDPAAGWNQNANEPPWLMTSPPLDPADYPAYLAPSGRSQPQMRALRSLRMIAEAPTMSYEQLLEKKHSTRMELADRVLPDLLDAAAGRTEAARVLERWDRHTDVDSRGAVLFQLFADRYFGGQAGIAPRLRVPYDPARPLDSAYGLTDPQAALVALAEAADDCLARYGALDVKWGDVYRFQSGNADLPGNGGAGASGLFRTIAFTRQVGHRYYAAHGETVVCAIEFGPSQRAQCLLGYGNASQPGSTHIEDQLPLMVEKRLRPVWRDRSDIEANLEKRQTF